MRQRNDSNGFLGIVVMIALLATMLVLYRGWRDCSAQHEHYVRGLFWMECVR